MNEITRFDELRADRALVGLDAAEEAELRWLAGGDALDDPTLLAAVSIDLATLGALEPLPAGVRARLLAPLAGPAPAPVPRRAGPTAWVPWAVAAAFFAVALTALLVRRDPAPVAPASSANAAPTASPAPSPSISASAPRPAPAAERRDALLARADAQRTPFAATKDPGATGAGGDVVWSSTAQEGYMTFRGLAANDPTRSQYQLWIFDADRDDRFPVDGGVFDVPPGAKEVVVPIVAKLRAKRPKLFAVTVEPPGGVVVSKREHIVLTAAPP